MILMEFRCWEDALTYYFFLLHIPITLLVDLSPIYPDSVVFALPRLIRQFYIATFNDPLLSGQSSPGGWFIGFLSLEGSIQLPICMFIVRKFWSHAEDEIVTRMIILCYSIQVLTTTWGCLSELCSFSTLSRAQLGQLIAFYAPYLAIPGIMLRTSIVNILRDIAHSHDTINHLNLHASPDREVVNRTILITGANSGVGFGIVEQIIDQHSTELKYSAIRLIFILMVRDEMKARSISERLLPRTSQYHSGVILKYILMNLTSLSSVNAAVPDINLICEELQVDLDFVICNAGMAQFTKIDIWKATAQALTHPVMAISAPNYKIQAVGGVTEDGLGITFQANFFGHYFLCGQLANASIKVNHVIWMSSLEATGSVLKCSDLQAINHRFAYESSKRLTDVMWSMFRTRLAHSKNSILEANHILVHPGFCATNIVAHTMLPALVPIINRLWTWTFYLARFCGSKFHTATAYNGAYAVAKIIRDYQPCSKTHARTYYDEPVKWGSAGRWDGLAFVAQTEYDTIDEVEASEIYDEIETLRQHWSLKLSSTVTRV